ncbi:MAG: hypothetical protein ACT4PS_08725 [Betaproteobacteria bacterium]
MMNTRPGEFDEEARAAFEAAAHFDTGGGLVTIDELAARGVLIEMEEGGEVVCRYLLTVEQHAHGLEAVILAAAGHAPGRDLTRAGIRDIEARISGCASIATYTRRPGLVRKLARGGFRVDGFILRKRLRVQ